MSKANNQTYQADKVMRRYLWAALVIMALPLLLEIFVLGPLFLLHMLNQASYLSVARIIGFTAAVAGFVGIAALPLIVSRKKLIKSDLTKRLYRAVVTVSVVYYVALIILAAYFFFLVQSNR